MTKITTAEDLFAGVLDTAEIVEVTAPTGRVFRIRGLGRSEVVRLYQLGDADKFENELLHLGLVEPSLTPEELTRWCGVPGRAAEVGAVSDAILKASGLLEESSKK